MNFLTAIENVMDSFLAGIVLSMILTFVVVPLAIFYFHKKNRNK